MDGTNRFTPSDPAFGRYDAAGNMTQSGQYGYDAESRLVTLGGTPTYTYDADGNRVAKPAMLYWAGSTLDALAESNATGTVLSEYIFFGGKRVARIDIGTPDVPHYYLSDHLGSTTVIASEAGAVESEEMYYPYGGERWSSGTGGNHYKFTGKERDSESGNDYFGARYYRSNMGRYLSPDWSEAPEPVPYADLTDPQSLNLYGYVRNNPVTLSDSDGHIIDTLLDIAFVAYDVYKIATEGATTTNNVALAADIGAALIPFATGAGMGVRAAAKAEHAVEAVVKAERLAANVEKGAKAEKAVEGILKAEGKEILGKQVGVRSQEGLRRVDIVTKDSAGKIVNNEVKSGGATRNAAQRTKDQSIATQGGTYVGKNAPADLKGKTIKVPTEVRKVE